MDKVKVFQTELKYDSKIQTALAGSTEMTMLYIDLTFSDFEHIVMSIYANTYILDI